MATRRQGESQYMLMREVAAVLNMSRRTVKRRLDEGKLEGVTDGGCIKVYRWSVEAYMANLQPVKGGGR